MLIYAWFKRFSATAQPDERRTTLTKEIPDTLLRTFEDEDHARSFVRGTIRFGLLKGYRHFEDSRRDETEGRVYLTWKLSNPVHCDCSPMTPYPRGTLQNRPYGVTSKPANEADPEHMMLYRAGDGSGKFFSPPGGAGVILTAPGRRVRPRRDATGAPTQGPE